MEKPDLLPCPFCGGIAQFVTTARRNNFCPAVECQSCGVNTGPGTGSWADEDGEKRAIASWNRRALINPQAMSDASDQLNTDRIDDAALALLSLGFYPPNPADEPNTQAATEIRHTVLARLYSKGMLACEPSDIPGRSVYLTPEGARRAHELFKKHFGQ